MYLKKLAFKSMVARYSPVFAEFLEMPLPIHKIWFDHAEKV